MILSRPTRGPFAAALLLSLLFLVWTGTAQAEKRIALVIGNGAYDSQPLSNPANDAALMAETLREVGFEVIEVIDADSRAMRKAVHGFSRTLSRSGEDAVGFVFYAGHGIQSKGENYLIPVDAEIEEAIDVEFEGFPATTLLSALANAGNRLNIVVMDACRNNPYKAATRSGGTGLARMDAPSGTLIAYSTAPGKVAADGRGRNSPYTRALARAINTPGAKVEDVFKTVRVAVMDRTNDAQVPWESSSLTGDFFFLDAEPEPVAQEQNATTVELAYWEAIKDSTDTGLFQAYLSQYPDGLFAPLAKAKIAAINNQTAAQRSQSDTAFFQAIQNSDSKGDFQAYLDQFPNGTFAALARARIADIERQNAETASRSAAQTAAPQPDADTAFWNEVKGSSSAAELQAYLNTHPNGRYAALARARIEKLTPQTQVAALTPAVSANPMDGVYRLSIQGDKSHTAQTYFPFCAPSNRPIDTLASEIEFRNGSAKTTLSSEQGTAVELDLRVSGDGTVSGSVNSRGKKMVTLEDPMASGRLEKVRGYADCRIVLTIDRISAPPPEPSAPPKGDSDRVFWSQVKDSGTVAELKGYLAAFPDGAYAEIAKAKIAGIRERRQVAALNAGAGAGHPMDGRWLLRWENVRQGAWLSAPFCALGEVAEEEVTVKDGKFSTRVTAKSGRLGDVRATLSENGTVRGFFKGLGWSAGQKSFTLTLKDGTGTARAERCGVQEFTLTRLSP